jgi:parallel beta-helix repeat protein
LAEHNTDYGIFFSRNTHDSIARNNYVYNTSKGIMVSESPNNLIYNNTVEGATSQAIRLQNPEILDDGSTTGNIVYNNVISNSENGIGAARSHDNVLENNKFSNIESSEYHLFENSSIIIRGQHFDNAVISQKASEIDSQVEIVDSKIIQVTEGANDGEEDSGVEDAGEVNEEDDEANSYNTDNELYRRTLSSGDSITVNS